jgi:hypothetical protein
LQKTNGAVEQSNRKPEKGNQKPEVVYTRIIVYFSSQFLDIESVPIYFKVQRITFVTYKHPVEH